MTMSRESIRQQMQEQRPSRKRQLYEVAPSPPKRLKQLTSDSPSSSPGKDPLVSNSDDETPRFKTKSFYGNKKKLAFPKPTPDAENACSLPTRAAVATSRSRSVTRMSGKMNSDKINKKTSKDRVALSPIKNVHSNGTAKQPEKMVSKVGANQRRGKSVPAKAKLNVEMTLPRLPQNTPDTDGAILDKTRKFFKHKSPGSASKSPGGIVLGKGFNLKFVRRSESKSSTKATPRKSGTSRKRGSTSKTRAPVNKSYPGARKLNETCSIGRTSPQNDMTVMETTPGRAANHTGYLKTRSTTQERSGVLRSTRKMSVDSQSLEDVETITSSSASSNKMSYEEPEIESSQDLSEFDSQSLPSDVSGPVVSSPSSVTTQQSEVSSAERMHNGKFYSIFSKKQRNSSRTATQSSSSTSVAMGSPKDSPMLRKFITPRGDNSQLMLDAGQEKFGATQCKICSMVYSPGNAADEAMHEKFHLSAQTALKFLGWKKERVIKDFLDDGSRVIIVLPDDHRFMVKKVEEVNRVMGQELGFPDQVFSFHGSYKAFLYVSDEKRVEGCCIAEPVTQGYRVLPSSDSQRPWFCSPNAEPATVGVGRLWVYRPSRKRGIATRLLDCVRQWFEYGFMIPRSQLAFSDPTPDGRTFAAKYTRTPHFLVYKYKHLNV